MVCVCVCVCVFVCVCVCVCVCVTPDAVEALTEEELGEHEEHLEEAFEETIERLSHCASECPEHFETNKDGHGNPNICYGKTEYTHFMQYYT